MKQTNKELREKSLAPNHAPTFWKYAILSDFCNRLIVRRLWSKVMFCQILCAVLACETCLIEAQYLTFRNTIP